MPVVIEQVSAVVGRSIFFEGGDEGKRIADHEHTVVTVTRIDLLDDHAGRKAVADRTEEVDASFPSLSR